MLSSSSITLAWLANALLSFIFFVEFLLLPLFTSSGLASPPDGAFLLVFDDSGGLEGGVLLHSNLLLCGGGIGCTCLQCLCHTTTMGDFSTNVVSLSFSQVLWTCNRVCHRQVCCCSDFGYDCWIVCLWNPDRRAKICVSSAEGAFQSCRSLMMSYFNFAQAMSSLGVISRPSS